MASFRRASGRRRHDRRNAHQVVVVFAGAVVLGAAARLLVPGVDDAAVLTDASLTQAVVATARLTTAHAVGRRLRRR